MTAYTGPRISTSHHFCANLPNALKTRKSMPPCEKVKPMCMPSVLATNCVEAASAACTTYSTGATNRNANSIGSVMPVRNEVSAAEIMMPPTATRFCGLALCHIAMAQRQPAEHLEKEGAGQDSRRGIAGEEAVDVAVHHRPARVRVSTHLEEERHVPDVVQTERDQQPLDETVDGRGRARVGDRRPVRERVDAVLYGRPDRRQHHAGNAGGERGDDRHGALAGEEREVGRQGGAVEALEHRRGDGAREDAAEDAGLHRLDSHDGHGLDAPDTGHHAENRQQHHVADNRRNRGDAVILGEANRDTDREDQRQVAEHHVSGGLHQRRHERRDPLEVRRADAEQQTCDRQHRHRNHQRLADLLQDYEGIFEHDSPLDPPQPGPNCASRARTSPAVLKPATSRARSWQSRADSRRTSALTAAIAGTGTESSSTPIPSSTGTASGSAAIPPHTPTHLPWRCAASTVRLISLRTAGCSASASGASLGWPRSIASVY